MKNTRIKKELEVVKVRTYFGTEDTDIYLKDSEGDIYHWFTRSEKAFEEMKEETKHMCSFTLVGMYSHYENKVVNTIKNVRF